jgi:hypothetical protein
MLKQQETAEKHYQQGRHYHDRHSGERSENLQQAIDCYERALHDYTFDAFPAKWEEIEERIKQAYSELAQMRRVQAQETLSSSRIVRRSRLTWAQCLVFGLVVLICLAIPTTTLTKVYLERGGPSCASGGSRSRGVYATLFWCCDYRWGRSQ